MNPRKVLREKVVQLTDLPNIGPAMAADLRLLGIDYPHQLRGRDPYGLYQQLCRDTGTRHDPCVLDVFISIVSFMEGGPPQEWWHFTKERKAHLKSA